MKTERKKSPSAELDMQYIFPRLFVLNRLCFASREQTSLHRQIQRMPNREYESHNKWMGTKTNIRLNWLSNLIHSVLMYSMPWRKDETFLLSLLPSLSLSLSRSHPFSLSFLPSIRSIALLWYPSSQVYDGFAFILLFLSPFKDIPVSLGVSRSLTRKGEKRSLSVNQEKEATKRKRNEE